MKLVRKASLSLAMLTALSSPVAAQLNGHNTLGDFGMLAGSQPAPGLYAAAFYYRYDTDTIRGRNGNRIALDPQRRGELAISAFAPLLWYVSDFKLGGANVGAAAAFPLVNAAIEAPAFGLQDETGAGMGDIWIQPLNLGWQTPRADVMTGFGFYAPTGQYEFQGDDNRGLGMWSFELFAGATVYLDEAKSWSIATNAYWETHTDKKDTDIKVGDVLTLEGGFGKSFLEGALNLGLAYYGQWKLSEDTLTGRSDFFDRFGIGTDLLQKHRTFAIGPDITLPLATKTKLIALINVRYFWELGVRSKTDGQSLVMTATFPIPSIPIP